MNRFKLTLIIFLFISFTNSLFAENNNFFEKGKKKYIEKKYEESKFLFQKSIVFNHKD